MKPSLKALLAWITVAAAAVGLVAIVAIAAVTSVMNVVAADLSNALDSVRVADEIEVRLLLHHETQGPTAQGASRAALMRALDETEVLVRSAEERRRVLELQEAMKGYFRPGADDADVVTALAAAHRLSMVNVEQGRRARERALFLKRLASAGGILGAIVLVAGLVGFLSWLRRGPFRQVRVLANTMERFSAGDLDARAPEEGPREVAVMARTFNATAGALVRARQRQAEYVATAIHDVRTPLTAIQLAVGYVVPGRPLPPEARVRELFALMGRQLVRLNGLLGDVLNATWIEAGELPLYRERFDLRSVVRESVDLFQSLAPEHVIELTSPSEPLFIYADRARLEQVVNNLISNAIKYSPLGSRVEVSLAQAGGDVVIAVKDEGQGIAPEDRPRIFETFQRRSATHEEAPGTSLGLWVSRRMVEAHGGQIELQSRVGRGSTFTVLLPLEAHAAHDAGEVVASRGSA